MASQPQSPASSRSQHHRRGGGEDPPPPPPDKEGRRLLGLLRSGDTVGDSDGGALLTYLSDCCTAAPVAPEDDDGDAAALDSSDDDRSILPPDERYRKTFRSVVVASLRAAQTSTAAAGVGGAVSSPGRTRPPLSPSLARRIASDGLLPLAACPSDYLVAEALWECVSEVILPCAVEGGGGGGGGDGGGVSTLGIEILLPSYLARLARCASPPGEDKSRKESVDPAVPFSGLDGVLDALCSIPSGASPSSSNLRLRPHSAAAVASSLGELEGISPGMLLPSPSSSDGTSKTVGGDAPPDRAASLVTALLQCLSEMASNGSRDLDSLPPLVYQLCLLPSRIRSDISGGAFGGLGGDGHRTRILAGVSDSFDRLMGDASDGASGWERAASDRRSPLSDAVGWAASTALAHIAAALRVDPTLVRAALRLVSDGGGGGANGRAEGGRAATAPPPPFRHARLTPFRLSIILTMASGVPRTRGKALEAVRDLVVEEETVRHKRRTSRWFNALAGTLVLDHQRSVAEGLGGYVDGGGRGRDSPLGFAPGTRGSVSAERKTGGPSEGEIPEEYLSRGGTDRRVLSCLLSVADFACSSLGGGAAECTSLLQSLVALGFALVDCVKRDAPPPRQHRRGLRPPARGGPRLRRRRRRRPRTSLVCVGHRRTGGRASGPGAAPPPLRPDRRGRDGGGSRPVAVSALPVHTVLGVGPVLRDGPQRRGTRPPPAPPRAAAGPRDRRYGRRRVVRCRRHPPGAPPPGCGRPALACTRGGDAPLCRPGFRRARAVGVAAPPGSEPRMSPPRLGRHRRPLPPSGEEGALLRGHRAETSCRPRSGGAAGSLRRAGGPIVVRRGPCRRQRRKVLPRTRWGHRGTRGDTGLPPPLPHAAPVRGEIGGVRKPRGATSHR